MCLLLMSMSHILFNQNSNFTKRNIVILLLGIAISLPISAREPSEDTRDLTVDFSTSLTTYEYLKDQDFAALDAMVNKWNNPEVRDIDGLWTLSVNWGSCTSGINWKESIHFMQKWQKSNPESIAAVIAETKCWIDGAWSIRGSESSADVDPVAMKVFTERIEHAEKILKDSKAFASKNPLWYDTYLGIAIAMKLDSSFIENMFNEGVSKYPDYHGLYIRMIQYWAPNNGRSTDWKKIDDIVNQAVSMTSSKDGITNYARLYAWVGYQQKLEFDFFKNSLVSWPKMRASYEELVKRYPSDSNLNEFAVYACRAGDKDSYLKLRTQIKRRVLKYKWPSNYSIDLCDHVFTNTP